MVSNVAKVISFITGFDTSQFEKCPIKYFKCGPGNVLETDKLVSGYSVDEKLPDGTPVTKPEGKMKCSHGGIFDNSSLLASVGGLNKDAGYYLLSPRADLHLIAAALAINHTEFYFDSLRKILGNTKFEGFLSLDPDKNNGKIAKVLDFIDKIIPICN